MSAFLVFGVLGLFLAHCDLPNPVIRYLSDASYWIYLVHLPLVLLIGGILSTTALPAALKWVATLTVSTPILLLTYHSCVRFTAIGSLLNGQSAGAPRSAVTELGAWQRGTLALEARASVSGLS